MEQTPVAVFLSILPRTSLFQCVVPPAPLARPTKEEEHRVSCGSAMASTLARTASTRCRAAPAHQIVMYQRHHAREMFTICEKPVALCGLENKAEGKQGMNHKAAHLHAEM